MRTDFHLFCQTIRNGANTFITPPAEVSFGALEVPNNQHMAEFMRRMIESIELLRKQNEDLNTRLIAAEGRNGRRDCEHEERQCEQIRKGRQTVNHDHDGESLVQ
jgi:hypothetical protein